MPHDLPPWQVVYQQSQRWIKAGVFESLVYDLRAVLRIADGRKESPTAAIISRTLQSTPESGGRAGYDGAKRRKGSKVHLAVDTLGGWMSRFRRLARDYERLPETLAGLHYVAFVILMLKNVAEILA